MAIDPLDTEKTMTSGTDKPGGYTLASGYTLGQYRIVRPLGMGGMGEVYEAEHETLGLRYALKLLPTAFSAQPGALDRFRREARVMANLDHPNILKVDDFGEVNGRYWLRMELATGAGPRTKGDGQIVSLQDLADESGGKIEQEMLAGILGHILEGLKFAHSHGVVHRDLKPANILIFDSSDGCTCKIADFGLVRLVGEDWVRDQANLSMQRSMSVGGMRTMGGSGSSEEGAATRSMLGTYEYMSPEQKRGEDATAQSDLYAVGLMAFKLLTGQNPSLKPPSRIDRQLSKDWDELLERAMEERYPDRWADAAAMLNAVAVMSRLTAPVDPIAEQTPRTQPAATVQPALQVDQRTVTPSGGREITVGNVLGMSFVEVKAGRFQMGTASGGYRYEKPLRTVRITRSFWMGKFEVTNGEYQRFVQMAKYDGSKESDENYLIHHRDGFKNASTADTHPIVAVSWNNAVAFCRWLTESERSAGRLPQGYVYRLPTEAEWEYAARGGVNGRSAQYAGSDDINTVAWYLGNSGDQRLDDKKRDIHQLALNRNRTHPVGAKAANELGLHDMSGNVYEWVHDWYQDNYKELATTDPSGPRAGSHRVSRGGSWLDKATSCRVAYRYPWCPASAFPDLGFRVVLAAPVCTEIDGERVPDVDDPHQAETSAKRTDAVDHSGQRGPVEGHKWTSPATGMEFVWIDALQIWVGKYEVTNGEYRRKEPRHDSTNIQDLSLNEDRQPVVMVNFDDAKTYAAWLTQQDRAALGGMRYRVPSEQEWVTYAQCGDGREYPWGNNWPPRSGQAGNYTDETVKKSFPGVSIIEGYDDGFAVTAPVDHLWRNPWGLYGVGGNVWEACASDSSGGSFGGWRGASWNFGDQEYLRFSKRFAIRGTARGNDLGFRLVLSPQ